MIELHRCIYNKIRDDAVQGKGVAYYRSYEEFATPVCNTDQRGAGNSINHLVREGWLVKSGLRRYTPADPNEDRRAIVAETAELSEQPLARVARVAFLLARGWTEDRVCGVIETGDSMCERVYGIAHRLSRLGFWNQG